MNLANYYARRAQELINKSILDIKVCISVSEAQIVFDYYAKRLLWLDEKIKKENENIDQVKAEA